MSYFRHAWLAAVLVTGATSAQAQTMIITPDPDAPRAMTEEFVLSPVQRRTVYRTIIHEHVRPARRSFDYRVGTRVPRDVTLYPVPNEVAVEVPAIRRYKYLVVNDRVVLVDPVTSEVVDEFVE